MRTPLALGVALFGIALAPLLAPQEVTPLSHDSSIAKVIDREGVGLARGDADPRWRCAEENGLLFANEWVKTGARGANALQLRTKSGATLTLGPGALVELVNATEIRIASGEVEIAPRAEAPITVRGPGDAVLPVAALPLATTTVVRARDGKLETVTPPPPWLTGYQSGQSTEAMGSLLANVDGRDVPLTLGYHKVTVDIRDQIARTIVEESFLNHTNVVLEGVFYFPLPADASISSFGMWIGDELVEGDIVEKERARAIYEQILREKRDPGLLEWTGGNLFKARVYPISGEKRIKIGWTQVLKKRGDQFTWNYALQSEMLRRTPLTQLAVEVTVSSAEPLAAVACPSHPCRISATDHAASVSFDAQEFRPDRDFELRITTKPATDSGAWRSSPNLSFVADQRGDDGYFMVRFSPPARDGVPPPDPQRPSDWLLLCDTSGSLRGAARATQLQFLEALLGSLGEHDTIQLATCDVETRFAFAAQVANSTANREAALHFVEQREALGWSDLAGAFKQSFAAMRPETQLVYVGDGVATLGDADPAKCAAAITAAFGGRGRVHAVVPGSTQEPIVLRAITRLGDGSLRAIGGGTDATQIAQELLADATQPRAKDVKIEFEGLAVAAVYPETLPSLADGEQQIVVGRWDARTGARAKVRVTSSSFKLETDVVLDDLGDKASFIPRLWARHHLDHLLAQPATADTKAATIALSQEFQIVTPYTSFLVLESEADRERFRLQKGTRMRDGEEFFAKGKSDAGFELAKAQMQKAAEWHVGLRREVLVMLAALDRDFTEALRPQSMEVAYGAAPQGATELSSWGFGRSDGGYYRGPGDAVPASVGGDGHGLRRKAGESLRQLGYVDSDGLDDESKADKNLGFESGEAESEPGAFTGDPGEPSADPASAAYDDLELDDLAGAKLRSRPAATPAFEMARSDKRGYLRSRGGLFGGGGGGRGGGKGDHFGLAKFERSARANDWSRLDAGRRLSEDWRDEIPGRVDPLLGFFVELPPPGAAAPPAFDGEVGALLRTLDQRARLAAIADALQLTVDGTSIDARGRRLTMGHGRWLHSNEAWFAEPVHRAGDDARIDWSRGGERGTWSVAWRIGRARAEASGDATAFALPPGHLFEQPGDRFRGMKATLARIDGGVRVTFRRASVRAGRIELDLAVGADPDSTRPIAERWFDDLDQLYHEVRWQEWQRVAGIAIAMRVIESSPLAGSRREWTLAATQLDAATAAREFDAALAPRAEVLELRDLPKDLATAKQLVVDGKATLEARWLLLRAAAARDDHTATRAAFADFAALAEATGPKRAIARLELTILTQVREHETLRQRLLRYANALAATPELADLARAEDLLALAGPLGAGDERLALIRTLTPVVERQIDRPDARYGHARHVLTELQQTPRVDEADALITAIARDFPERSDARIEWAQLQATRGDLEAGLKTIADAIATGGPWSEAEHSTLADARVHLLWNGYRLEQLIDEAVAESRERQDTMSETQLDRWCTALLYLDREAAWWQQIERWLNEARAAVAADKFTRPIETRLATAIAQALGQSGTFNWWNRTFTDAEAKVLIACGAALLDHERAGPHAQQLLGFHSLAQTLEARTQFGEIWKQTAAEVESAPATRLARRIALLKSVGFQPDGEEAGWQKLFDRLFARSRASSADEERLALEETVTQFGRRELQLGVLRERVARAKEGAPRGAAVAHLFDSLIGAGFDETAWTEAVALLPQVGPVEVFPLFDEADARFADVVRERDARVRAAQILAWHDFVNWSVDARAEAAVKARPDFTELPRKKLKVAQDEAVRAARTTTREWLAQRNAAASAGDPRPWLQLDRIWLDVLLRNNLAATRTDSLALLDAAIDATSSKADDAIALDTRIVAQRAATTLLFLLTRVEGEERAAHERELLAVTEPAAAAKHPLLDWRGLDYLRLVALDRGDELQAKLREWLGDGKDFTRQQYGRQLAWICAERGQLEEAIRVAEALTAGPLAASSEFGSSELEHNDWLALSGWCTALDRKDAATRARLAAWSAIDEYALADQVNHARGSLNDRGDGVPAGLPDEVPEKLIALMRKATWPEQQLWTVRELYGKTKDFRLLECLPEAVIGHTAQGIYRYLSQLAGAFQMVDEEATVDRVVEGLAMARERATSVVDRRALDYLEFLARWQAAAQTNGGGPHATAALAAMKRAFVAPIENGEEVPLAQFLASLDRLGAVALQDEQIRQLAALVARAAASDDTRLVLGFSLATAQWNANRHDEAIRTIVAELGLRRVANGGRLPDSANGPLGFAVDRLAIRRRHADAEQLVAGEIAVARHGARVQWLDDMLHGIWARALREGGRVAFGSSAELFAKADVAIAKKLTVRTNEGRAYQLIDDRVEVMRSAHQVGVKGVGDAAQRLAFEELPKILADYQYRNGQTMISQVAQVVHETAGPKEAVEFFVVRAENEPRWIARIGQHFFDYHSWSLADVRRKAARLDGRLEQRLLALVTRELRAEMRNGNQRGRAFYAVNYDTFWSSKADDFAQAAQAELAEGRDDEPVALRVASYLYDGLRRYEPAIAVLRERLRGGRLGLDGQTLLAQWLHAQSHDAEARPLTEALIAARPDALELRFLLMAVHSGLHQRDAADSVRAAAEARWREMKRFGEEEIVRQFGWAAYEAKLWQPAADYYGEAIEMHARSAPNRGVGDGTLGPYYQRRSEALSQVGKHVEAIDAAAGAVVAWGAAQEQRKQALAALEEALASATDLDAFTARVEAEVAASGLENPLLRKSIGKAWLQKRQPAKAETQWQAALAAAPDDEEIAQLLVTLYDQLKRPEQAIAALFARLDANGHDVAVMKELGERLQRMEDPARAERVHTQLVEALLGESEGHQALAEVRDGQRRWTDAAEQWRQVARIRATEPTGWLGLAKSLLRAGDRPAAKETIDHLLGTDWDARFGDVKTEARRLLTSPTGSF